MNKKLKMQCPEGHSLPHITKNGECTPLYCCGMGNKEAKKVRSSKHKRAVKAAKTTFEERRELAIHKATKELELKVAAQPQPLPDGANGTLVNEGRLEVLSGGSVNLGRHRARLAFIEDLPKKDADEVTINNWADKKTLQLVPIAIAEKEFQLRFGDDGQRERAADRILAMAGRATKEGSVSGGAAIILNIGSGGLQLPYMPQRLVDSTAKELPEGEHLAKKLP